jgi:hypothetical protein
MHHSSSASNLAIVVRVLTSSYTAVRLATSEVSALHEGAIGSCAIDWLHDFT